MKLPQCYVQYLTLCLSECADEKGKWDELVEVEGVRVLVEPNALMHLIGTRMDYVQEKLR